MSQERGTNNIKMGRITLYFVPLIRCFIYAGMFEYSLEAFTLPNTIIGNNLSLYRLLRRLLTKVIFLYHRLIQTLFIDMTHGDDLPYFIPFIQDECQIHAH